MCLCRNTLMNVLRTIQVPRHPPTTRELWSEWTKIWPIVWRQPDFGPLALRPEAAIVDGAATEVMQGLMGLAWRLALDARAAGQSFNAAIIVDPARGTRHTCANQACIASHADCCWPSTGLQERLSATQALTSCGGATLLAMLTQNSHRGWFGFWFK